MRYILSGDRLPEAWFNVVPHLPEPLQPPLHPGTREPVGPDDLAPLFPMARRDGAIEVDRAPEPPLADRWTRPVATLVDGDTASAAEMIAGALSAYHRGPVVGERTYGKGCAQEYLDDDAQEGVVRLTTLLYALPDGTRERHEIIGILLFGPSGLAEERVYASERLLRLMLGPIYDETTPLEAGEPA